MDTKAILDELKLIDARLDSLQPIETEIELLREKRTIYRTLLKGYDIGLSEAKNTAGAPPT